MPEPLTAEELVAARLAIVWCIESVANGTPVRFEDELDAPMLIIAWNALEAHLAELEGRPRRSITGQEWGNGASRN